jgi:hypothetical protein
MVTFELVAPVWAEEISSWPPVTVTGVRVPVLSN